MLKPGYGNAVIAENIRAEIRAGRTKPQAIAAALSAARKSFFQRYPHGALPVHLAFPRQHRTREFYDAGGRPIATCSSADYRNRRDPDALRVNPAPRFDAKKIDEARRRYSRFSGHTEFKQGVVKVPRRAREMLAVGKVLGIMYETVRDGRRENYLHKFREQSRPLFAVSSDGTQLHMLGGAYRFTERGIVDR